MLIRIAKVVLPLVVLGLAVLAAVTMIRNRPPVETQAPVVTPPGVRVHIVELERARISVTSQGTVRPRTETQLVPEISGRVTWVASSFAAGGFFDEGDVLLRIDPFDYQQAVVSARSQLAQARLRLAQEEAEAEVAQREWEELGRGDPRELTLRKPQLEDARASVAAAEANLVRAERDLERANVVAPYAGRVRTKDVDVGQFVTVGAPLATIYSVDAAEVRLPLPDEELAYLDLPLAYRGVQSQIGPRVTLRSTFAGSTYEWDGRIVRTEGEIDPVSRMVHVVAEVRDPYAPGPSRTRPPLAVGMYVEAEIDGRVFDDIAILPRAALRGRNQVLTVDADDRVRFRDVDILRATTSSVYVQDGLASGDRVTISALDGPTDGMLVQITESVRRERPPESAAREDTRGELRTAARSTRPLERRLPPEPAAEAGAAPTTIASSDDPAWLRDLLAETRDRPIVRTARAGSPPGRPPSLPPSAGPPRLSEACQAPDDATPPPTTPSVAAPEHPASRVIVRAFTNVSRASSETALAQALSDAVVEGLADLDSVTLVQAEDDAAWLVTGGIQRVGNTLRITASVVDVAHGAVVHAIKVDGSADDGARLRDQVVAELARTVSEVAS